MTESMPPTGEQETTQQQQPPDQGEPLAAEAGRELPRGRAAFRSLLAANPNYFGSFPDLGFDVVEPKSGDTTFEEIDCVSYSPTRDRIEATILVKLSFGYSGGLCTRGSFEHLRFYVDYGGGWQDAGPAGISVHDIPVEKDCAGQPTHPLSYVAGVSYAPHRSWCGRPVLPRVRAILSWELPPPPGQPDWVPIWGSVHECNVQIAPRRFVLADIAEKLPKELVAELPPQVLAEPPHPTPDPAPVQALSLESLVQRYAQADVPPHRFAFPALAEIAESPSVDTATLASSATTAKQAGVDLGQILKLVESGKGNVDYEELECLGLDAGLQSLVASFRIKRPSGYSGPPCSAGSTEYVAFWADFDGDCRYTYLGTVPVQVHDYVLPEGGLCYAAILPVDTGAFRRSCEQPVLPRVRAVLSWGTPPSVTDPDAVPFWGNRLDRHVQLEPGRPYDGYARFTIVGGVAAQDVDLASGLTLPGAKLGASVIPLDPPDRPFAGLVTLQGPLDPALVGHQYRIRATDVDGGGSVILTSPFTVVTSGGVATTVTPNPLDGWVPWPTWTGNTTGLLGVHVPGGDDRWDYTLELDTAGNTVDVARVQMDNTVRAQAVASDTVNAGDLELFTAGACRQPRGPLSGRFVARDRHFESWSISLLGGPGGPIPPTPLTVGIAQNVETPFAGTPFTLDLSALQPCGYVVRLTIADRAIVNSVTTGQHATVDRGVCLE
jgi:hypothetical protein